MKPAIRFRLLALPFSALLLSGIGPATTLRQDTPEDVPAKVKVYIDAGDRLFRAKRYDEAIAQYNLAIQASDRPYQTPYLNLGSAQHENGDYQAAVDSFRKAARIKPHDYRAHYNLAESLYALGVFPDAEAEYREVIRLSPSGMVVRMAHHFLGLCLYRQKRRDEAIIEYKVALELSGGVYAEAHYNLGIALLEKKDYAGAESEFRKALEQEQPFPEARMNLGVALEFQKRIPEAIKEYELYLSLVGDTVEARELKKRLERLKRAN